MTSSQIKAIVRAFCAARRYLRDDQRASYPLPEPVRVEIRGVAIADILGARASYTTADGSISIVRNGPDAVTIVAHEFPRSAGLWNGPDIIPNRKLRSMLASLFHDLVWGHAEEMARALGWSAQEIYEWGDGVLYAVWRYASKDSWWGRQEARLAWRTCEWARPWYRRVKKILAAAIFATGLCAGCGGCTSPPDWEVAELEGGDVVEQVMRDYGDGLMED